MTRRRWIVTGVVLLVLGLGALPMTIGGESARRRARRYFVIQGPVDTVSLRAAVLRVLPPGTAEGQIDEFVLDRRIGMERGTFYYQTPAGRGIRIDDLPGPIQLVTGTYAIDLEMDSTRKLRDVHVHEWFTGP